MAVLAVQEISGRESEGGEDTSRRYRQRFRAICDITDEDPLAVRLAAGVPRVLQSYVLFDSPALCTNVVARQTDDPWVWEIDVTYSTLSFGRASKTAGAASDPGQRVENPLLRPVQLQFGAERYQKAVQYDRDGHLVANAAGDPFDPPVEIDDFRPTLTVVRNEPTFDPFLPVRWKNAVNELQWSAYPPETVKVAEITARNAWENNVYFYEVTYQFLIDPDGWTFRRYNAGFNAYTELFGGAGNDKQPIKFADGTTPAVVQPLDEDGLWYPTDTPDFEPVFLTFNMYPRKDFAELEIF